MKIVKILCALAFVFFATSIASVSNSEIKIPQHVSMAKEARELLASLTSVQENETLLGITNDTKKISVIRVGAQCKSLTQGFTITCQGRGINARYKVVEPKGYVVYAEKIGMQIVYTPYSHLFNTEEVREYGRYYLSKILQNVYQDLAKRDVRSLVNKNDYVYRRVPQEVIENLIVVEHMDHSRLGKVPVADLINEVYTTIGMNQGLAYIYTVSPAQARGLTQMIPKTYDGLKRLYGTAGLVSDFSKGMKIHANAIKASILLADHDFGIIPSQIMRAELLKSKNRKKYNDFIASSYNGGPNRSVNLLMKGKDHYSNNDNEENKMYVLKMRAVG